ncbi:hypothetical protein U1Q18_034959, partial [Sarracenia purpurea var. burkii]
RKPDPRSLILAPEHSAGILSDVGATAVDDRVSVQIRSSRVVFSVQSKKSTCNSTGNLHRTYEPRNLFFPSHLRTQTFKKKTRRCYRL